jgi:aryl-alcohol dehydrogenase-like predicted oxidoreductase
LLTGKYHHGVAPDKGRFSPEVGNFGVIYPQRYWHDHEFQTIEKLRELAEQAEVPLATLSIAWVLANPVITSVILGASRPDQLKDTFAAVELVLDANLKTQLDDLTAEYRRGDAAR